MDVRMGHTTARSSDDGDEPEEREQISGSSQHTSSPTSEQAAGIRFRGRKAAQPHRVQKLSDHRLESAWDGRVDEEETSPQREMHSPPPDGGRSSPGEAELPGDEPEYPKRAAHRHTTGRRAKSETDPAATEDPPREEPSHPPISRPQPTRPPSGQPDLSTLRTKLPTQAQGSESLKRSHPTGDMSYYPKRPRAEHAQPPPVSHKEQQLQHASPPGRHSPADHHPDSGPRMRHSRDAMEDASPGDRRYSTNGSGQQWQTQEEMWRSRWGVAQELVDQLRHELILERKHVSKLAEANIAEKNARKQALQTNRQLQEQIFLLTSDKSSLELELSKFRKRLVMERSAWDLDEQALAARLQQVRVEADNLREALRLAEREKRKLRESAADERQLKERALGFIADRAQRIAEATAQACLAQSQVDISNASEQTRR